MKKIDFCELLSDIHEDYLEEARTLRNQPPAAQAKSGRKLSALLIAACICLLISSVTVLAASDFGTQIITFFTDRGEQGSDLIESGYDIRISIERIPTKALTGEVREIGASIMQQYKEYQPYSSWFPGHWQKTFASRESACAYIGFDGLKQPDLGLPEVETKLSVYGDRSGEILFLYLETLYTDGDIRLQFFSEIYTENYPEEITTGFRTTESVAFEESFYTTGSNKRVHIIESSAMESGYTSMDGYLVDSGVLYQLHIAYPEKDAERAEILLYRWAEQF